MKKTHAGKLVLAAVAVGSLLAACSDDKKDTTATTAAPTTSGAATTAPGTTDASATTAAADTGTTLSADDLLATVQMSFDKVFANANMDPAYMQNSDAHTASMDASRADEAAKAVSITVKSAEYATDADCEAAGETAPCVAVLWDLVYQGTVAIPDNHGFAVYEDGIWKVSEPTYCSVATLGNHNLDC